jgi:hypothetical protein
MSRLAMATVVDSPTSAVARMMVGSLGTGCSNVVVDSIVVNHSRGEPQAGSCPDGAHLISTCWRRGLSSRCVGRPGGGRLDVCLLFGLIGCIVGQPQRLCSRSSLSLLERVSVLLINVKLIIASRTQHAISPPFGALAAAKGPDADAGRCR